MAYFFVEPDILDLNETNCRICWSAYRLPSHSDLVTYQVEVTRTKDQEQIMVCLITICFYQQIYHLFLHFDSSPNR